MTPRAVAFSLLIAGLVGGLVLLASPPTCPAQWAALPTAALVLLVCLQSQPK